MSDRTLACRARRSVGAAVSVAMAVLGFAQAANAAGTTYPSTVQTPGSTTGTPAANGSALLSAVTGLASGTNNVIQLCDCTYQLPANGQLAIPTNVQVEITGPPLLQATGNAGDPGPTVDGGQVGKDVLTTAVGDNVILKGFNLTNAPSTFSAVKTNAGNVEFDNMALYNQAGNGVTVAGGNVAINNTTIADNQSTVTNSNNGVTQTGGALVLNHTTISNNAGYGISGTAGGYKLFGSLIAGNNGQACHTPPANKDVNTWATDLTCNDSTDASLLMNTPAAYYGGPAESEPIAFETAANTNPGAGSADAISSCPLADDRFFDTPNTSSCDPGAYQTNGTQSSEAQGVTAPITCQVTATNEISSGGTGQSTQTVGVSDSTSYLGPDTILSATTDNGTISWPTVTGTTFDQTNGLGWNDAPTNAAPYSSPNAYQVTAFKTAGDATQNDAHWSFTAMDWLGNTKLCK